MHQHFESAMKVLRLQVLWFLAFLLSAGADPFVGIWKLDPHMSKFTPGDPSLMVATMQIESTGKGLKSTVSGADGEGLANNMTFNCTLDGTPCKVKASVPMRGAAAVDTISLQRVDDHTIRATGLKNGNLVYSDQRVVSANGETMTVIRKGTTPEGRKYQSKVVLARLR